MCFYNIKKKWVQLNGRGEKENESDGANRNETENDINKLILKAGGYKKQKPLQLCLQKQQGHPRERERETDSREEEEDGRSEGNKEGI